MAPRGPEGRPRPAPNRMRHVPRTAPLAQPTGAWLAGLALLALFVAAAPVSALDPRLALTQYGRRTWTSDQGLPQNSVHAIEQTADGYLWLGTQEGLARFDGVRFVVFDQKNTPAFSDHRVSALHEDRAGSLWIGTWGGGVLRLRAGRFERFDAGAGLPNNRVCTIFEDRRGRLWIGTEAGLARLEGGRFVVPPGLNARPYVVMAMAESDEGLWIGTDGDGLLRLTDAIEVLTTRQGLSSDAVRALHLASDGSLWVGTRTGLDRLVGGRFVAVPAPQGAWSAISALREDAQGNLWVGTRGGGLARLHGGTWSVLGEEQGLSSNVVLSAELDREGSLWVGTEGAGLNQLRDVRFTSWGKPEGLGHEMLVPILEDRAGSVWMGSYGGGLFRLRDGRFRAYSERDGLTSNLVASLLEDRHGALWVGTDGGGLNRLKDDRVERFGRAQGLSSDRVIALLEDRQGALWIGTYGGGLCRLENGRVTTFGRAQGLTSELVMSLAEDRQGRLWIGTDGGGLNALENGRFRAYTTEQGLANDTVFRIYEDQAGTLWVGTYGGLSVLRDGRLRSLTRAQGLFDERLFQILEDDQQNLWMSSNKGVFRVSKAEIDELLAGRRTSVASMAYGTVDGMRSSECNGNAQPAGWKARDGSLWFPTTRGAVRVDPARAPAPAEPPPVAVEEVAIDGRSYPAGSAAQAPPGRGEVEIHYAGLGFREPERLRFRYQLEGYDPDFVEAGPRRVAYYTNLPPGRYRFLVQVAAGDGPWGPPGAEFPFELRPRFYRAPWFFAVSALVVLAAAWGAHRLRVRRLAANERRLAALVAERTRELEAANQQLARFSDLDAVTGIANRRYFDACLEAEWRRMGRGRLSLALLMVDVDHFKAYNDAYGHQRGDECLRSVAQALQRGLHRPGDTCARYGGEEFGVILPATEAAGAQVVAEGLRRAVEELALPHAAGERGLLTISVGAAAVVPGDDLDVAALLAAADAALYAAKRAGRNRALLAAVPPRPPA